MLGTINWPQHLLRLYIYLIRALSNLMLISNLKRQIIIYTWYLYTFPEMNLMENQIKLDFY